MEALTAAFQALVDSQCMMLEELRQPNLKPATTNTDAPTSVSSHPNNISPFENYDQCKRKFSQLTRFEHYLALGKVTDEKQKVHDSEHDDNLGIQLNENEKDSDLAYDKLVESLTKLLTEQKSEVEVQHYFINIKHQEKQTIMRFVTDLKKNLTECNTFL